VITDLARCETCEEVFYLLWHRRLPTRAELGDLQSELAAARALPEPILRLMKTLPSKGAGAAASRASGGDAMDLLRTLTSALSHYDPDASDQSPAANMRQAGRLTAQRGTLVATVGRMNAGGGVIQPDPVLGHAANFLYMLTGERPSGLAAGALDVAV